MSFENLGFTSSSYAENPFQIMDYFSLDPFMFDEQGQPRAEFDLPLFSDEGDLNLEPLPFLDCPSTDFLFRQALGLHEEVFLEASSSVIPFPDFETRKRERVVPDIPEEIDEANGETLSKHARLVKLTRLSPPTSGLLIDESVQKIRRHLGNQFAKYFALTCLFSGELPQIKPLNIDASKWKALKMAKQRGTSDMNFGLLRRIAVVSKLRTTKKCPTDELPVLSLEVPCEFDDYCKRKALMGAGLAEKNPTKVCTETLFRWWSYDRSVRGKNFNPLKVYNHTSEYAEGVRWIRKEISLPRELTNTIPMQELSPFDSMKLVNRLCLEVLKTCVSNFDYELRSRIGFAPHQTVNVTHRIEKGFDIAIKKVIALYYT